MIEVGYINKTMHNKSMSKSIFLKSLLGLLFIFTIISCTYAEQQSFGTFKQNSCINLIQTCDNCTYNNITKIVAPNSNIALQDLTMTKIGTVYNLSFCSTSQIGTYVVNGVGDLDGVDTVWNYSFEITPSGFTDTLGFYFLLIVILGAVIGLGFFIKDGWFVVIGGMSFVILGVYSINSGIAGFRDMFLTWAVALFEIGTGAYLSINSAIELIGDTEVA